MSDLLFGVLMFTVIIFAAFGFVSLVSIGHERDLVMREAFERGYAVQCLGKEGYYWECDE